MVAESHTEAQINELIVAYSRHFSKLSELTHNSGFFALREQESESFSVITSDGTEKQALHVFVDTLPRKDLINPALQIYLHALKSAGFVSKLRVLLAKDFLAKKQQGVPKLSCSVVLDIDMQSVEFAAPEITQEPEESVFNLKELIDERE